jgi:hypothetical protein
MGPEGGAGGGTVVATGTPEDVAANPASHTGRLASTDRTPPVGPRPAQGRPRGSTVPGPLSAVFDSQHRKETVPCR